LKTKQVPNLHPGDVIALISTARKIGMAELTPSIKVLESWTLKVKLGEYIFEEQDQFAGSVAQRTSDLQKALDDKSIKAVIFVRGGYGSIQVVDGIDWTGFQEHPKWLIGFSDITVFHSHIHQNFKISTLHAAMPITFASNTETSLNKTRSSLFGETLTYEVEPHPYNRKGIVEAEIIGGNLSILYGLLGSESQLNTKGKILFIEDLDEYLYHIDRMLYALKRAGMLENLAGLLVGGMSDMKDNAIPFGKNAEEIIRDVVAEYNFPVAFNFPAGHIDHNMPLIFGKKLVFEVGKTVKLHEIHS
jgi:muramoyltetrapeptide carboxypeptidase